MSEPQATKDDERFLCMMCFQEPQADEFGYTAPIEEDEYGDAWSYCRKCDCWTSHPPITPRKDRSNA